MSKTLRDLAEVHYGKSPNEVLSDEAEIPVFGTGGAYSRASRALFQSPAVVVPRKGSLGNPQFVGTAFWASDTTYAVLPKPKVDAKWLYYSLAAFDLTKLNEATGVPSINRDWLYRIKLGPHGYGEQQRIAEVLSTVDEAIEQTEALVAKLQQMKAGLMHDDLFTRGVTQAATSAPSAPKLTISTTSRIIADSYKRSEVRSGEIVCAIRATVGKVLKVPPELDGANLTQGTARISPNSKIDSAFSTLGHPQRGHSKSNLAEHQGNYLHGNYSRRSTQATLGCTWLA